MDLILDFFDGKADGSGLISFSNVPSPTASASESMSDSISEKSNEVGTLRFCVFRFPAFLGAVCFVCFWTVSLVFVGGLVGGSLGGGRKEDSSDSDESDESFSGNGLGVDNCNCFD